MEEKVAIALLFKIRDTPPACRHSSHNFTVEAPENAVLSDKVEEKLRTLLKISPVGFCYLNGQGDVVEFRKWIKITFVDNNSCLKSICVDSNQFLFDPQTHLLNLISNCQLSRLDSCI
jgi:hypothetical protein